MTIIAASTEATYWWTTYTTNERTLCHLRETTSSLKLSIESPRKCANKTNRSPTGITIPPKLASAADAPAENRNGSEMYEDVWSEEMMKWGRISSSACCAPIRLNFLARSSSESSTVFILNSQSIPLLILRRYAFLFVEIQRQRPSKRKVRQLHLFPEIDEIYEES